MWQMALSMKIFGVSEWAMRLPSVIMGTLLIIVLYRIAKLVTSNEFIALFSAGLLAVSGYHLQLIAGIQGMDHNDVAHGFYILLSIWAFLEYSRTGKISWVVLVGIFAGAAVLNKWLTGLLVFLGWGVYLLADLLANKKLPLKNILHLVLAVVVCCLVFVPWQLYILHTFPELARHEYAYNTQHIFKAVEGHEGSWAYYFVRLDNLIGYGVFLLVPVGMFLISKTVSNQKAAFMLLVQALFVFCFYSFIVKTKIETYVFFIVPIFFIFIAIAVYQFIQNRHVALKTLAIALAIILVLRPEHFLKYYSSSNHERNERIYNAAIYRNLKKELPSNIHLVMNMNSFEDIDVMFYNNHLTAYAWTVSEEEGKALAAKKVPIAVFKHHGSYGLPDWINKYPYLYVIDKELKNF